MRSRFPNIPRSISTISRSLRQYSNRKRIPQRTVHSVDDADDAGGSGGSAKPSASSALARPASPSASPAAPGSIASSTTAKTGNPYLKLKGETSPTNAQEYQTLFKGLTDDGVIQAAKYQGVYNPAFITLLGILAATANYKNDIHAIYRALLQLPETGVYGEVYQKLIGVDGFNIAKDEDKA